jgi:hypothetical protein
MTATTTADADAATGRLLADSVTWYAGAIGGAIPHTTHTNIRANYRMRHGLLVALLLLVAAGGFVTARLTSAPVHEPAVRVCSETCHPLSTTTRAPQAGASSGEGR